MNDEIKFTYLLFSVYLSVLIYRRLGSPVRNNLHFLNFLLGDGT